MNIADVLLVTVTKVESKAVFQAFQEVTKQQPKPVTIDGRVYQDLGVINKNRVFMAQSEMGSGGVGASHETIQKGITSLSPWAVILVGIAFGVDANEQAIGDILISDRIMRYEPQKVSPNGMVIPRGERAPASSGLVSQFKSAELHWDDRKATTRFGLILSGEKLIDDLVYLQKLIQIEPEAIGGEMEGDGLYVACQSAKKDWILVKSICDWADGNKSQDRDNRQQLAARNAAEFVLHALQHTALTSKPDEKINFQQTEITLNRNIEEFTPKEQSSFKLKLASILEISIVFLINFRMKPGSVVVSVEMPDYAAQKLTKLFENKSYDLAQERYESTKAVPDNKTRELEDLRITSVKVFPKTRSTTDEFSRISEKASETNIVDALSISPFYKLRPGTALDVSTFIDINELVAFVQATQPKEWAKLARQFPGNEANTLVTQLSNLIQKRGTLDVLRNGVAFNGINLQLAYFKPSATGNPEHQSRYEENRFGVMKQVYFSVKEKDPKKSPSVDIVITLNGLPIISIELKNHFTGQNVQHAIAQYRRRDAKEPFWSRCLVHFAVDDDSVYMTTRLQGVDTEFLPFNRDTQNPVIYGNFASAYLWLDFTDEDNDIQPAIFSADSLLLLIQNYLHYQKDEKTGKERFIFPRFHQLMAVRKLVAHAREYGSGYNYLIQHSAGSGKSNSIAWLAHQLANLFDEYNHRVFDSIVVITDRRVLDKQLQDTIKQFEKVKGVVTKIDRNTRQLIKALERGDSIIITTLQKFGFIGELAQLPGKRFAIIVDEAHSSQTGENVKDLKIALTSDEQLRAALERDDEAEEIDPLEDELERIQKSRQRLRHLSFFAFTATPKPKTLELFGIKDPTVKEGYRPFHTYSMRQAIDEGFILDVLQSYTTYKTYFELVENENADNEKLLEKSKTRRLLLEYVDRHEFAIERKAHIIVDHFVRKTAHKINGQAKAMVVTHSRAHAVLYYQAICRIIREENLNFGVLVAFSGSVTIDEKKFTEENLNPPGTGDIAEAFKKPEQRILIAANKFQTGFDQPLLHTMYVDKKLGGVAAVQTLSRINRTAPGKDDTMILDFVNEQSVIQASFQDYYQRTELEGETDPNKLYNIKYSLEQMGVFNSDQVDEFAVLFIEKKAKGSKVFPIFQTIVEKGYLALSDDDQVKFRKELARYVRQYNFISQIMTFTDVALEKFYLFAKLLLKQLPYHAETLPKEVLDMVDMDKYRVQEEQNGRIVLTAEDATLDATADDGHRFDVEEEREKLQKIVQKINEDYGIEFSEADRVVNAIKQKLEADDNLRKAFQSDSIDFLRRQKLQDSIKQAFLDNVEEYLDFMSKTETDPGFGKFFFSEMYKWYEQVTSNNPKSE